MFTFELWTSIYYLLDNKVHSAPVLARMCVDNAREDWANTNAQKELYTPFGKAGVYYATCHGIISEHDAFGSREDLAGSLVVENQS